MKQQLFIFGGASTALEICREVRHSGTSPTVLRCFWSSRMGSKPAMKPPSKSPRSPNDARGRWLHRVHVEPKGTCGLPRAGRGSWASGDIDYSPRRLSSSAHGRDWRWCLHRGTCEHLDERESARPCSHQLQHDRRSRQRDRDRHLS